MVARQPGVPSKSRRYTPGVASPQSSIPALRSTSAVRRRLMNTALGKQPADTLIRRARVLDVFTATFLPEHDVAVADGRIAYVGADASHTVGPATTLIDADGQVLLPGFIDGHTHAFAVRYSIEEFLKYVVPGGTTTVITELTELGSVLGYDGIRTALDGLARQPIKLFATLPPLAALLPHMESTAPTLDEYRQLLGRPEVLGLGELYWNNLVIGQDERMHALVEATLESGKVAEGHGAGARGPRLQSYVCGGLSSDHEPINAVEGLERLRLGQTFMAREGEIRQDLEAIAPIWHELPDLRRMTLVTDSVGAERLLEHGYLERNVQKAIDLGLEPARAVQMVTLNVAEHFRIDADVGSIAPGRCADLVMVPDERTIQPSLVLSDGRVVARDSELLEDPRRLEWPRRFFVSVKRKRMPRPDDLGVSAEGQATARVRAIECTTGLVTQETEIELTPQNGELLADPAAGVLKVAAFDRVLRTEAVFVGFIKGFGLREGAVASSMTWDSQCLVVIGGNDHDMALAADRLVDTQGGAAVCLNGDLVADLEAPLGGLTSLEPMPVIAQCLAHVRSTLEQLGCPWPNPLLTVDVLTTASIPFFRITDRGYVRLRTGEQVGLFV
jgi:adenine deaminase